MFRVRNFLIPMAMAVLVGSLAAVPALAQEGGTQPTKAQRLLISGNELMQSRRYLDAAEQFRLALDEDPEMVDALRNLAFVYTKMAETDAEYYEDALETYEELESQIPEDIEVKKNKAYVYTQLDDWEAAIDTYQEIVVLDPKNCVAFGAMGELHKTEAEKFPKGSDEYTAQLTEAAAKFNMLIEACPDEMSAYNAVGEIWFALGNMEKASEVYEALLVKDPKNADVAGRLGYLWYQSGDAKRKAKDKAGSIPLYERSIPFLAQVLELDPSRADYRGIYANALKFAGRFDEAAAQFQMIIDSDETKQDLYCSLGFLYLDAKDHEKAIEMAMQAIANGAPGAGCLYCIWGKGLEGRGILQYEDYKFSRAISTYTEAKAKYTVVLSDEQFGTYATNQITRLDQLIAQARAAKAKFEAEGGK